jgi:hypothetical protein
MADPYGRCPAVADSRLTQSRDWIGSLGTLIAQSQRIRNHLLEWLYSARLPGGGEHVLPKDRPGGRNRSRKPRFLLQR